MIQFTAPITAYTMPGDRDIALEAILDAMAQTTESWLQRMYGFTHPAIAAGYLAMHQRGIQVELLLDHSQSVGPTEAALLHQMILQGFPADHICITTSVFHEIMHTKEAIRDENLPTALVIEGSLNFSPTAFTQDNTVLFIPSNELCQDAGTRFDAEQTWAKQQEAAYQLTA